MKEPISTITNAAYAIAAVLVWDWWLSIALLLLALTSAGYHWTKSYEWRMADVQSMLLVMSVLVMYVFNVHPVFALFLTAILILADWNRTAIVIVWFALVVAGSVLNNASLAFVIPFAIGGLSNIPFLWLNWNRKLTDAIHGIWHIATAAGLYMLYLTL